MTFERGPAASRVDAPAGGNERTARRSTGAPGPVEGRARKVAQVEWTTQIRAWAVFGALVTILVVALAVDDDTFGWPAGYACFALLVYGMTLVPQRYSMMGMIFLGTVLPNPGEGQPTPWVPPFALIGQAMLNHLNTLDRTGTLGGVPVSLMEILFVVQFAIFLYRRATKSTIDGPVTPTPRPLIAFAFLSLGISFFSWIKGIAAHGDVNMSLWQLNAVIYVPIVFLLFQTCFRGPEDHWALAKVYLCAAAYKCLLAVYVVETITMPMDPETGSTRPPYGTAHADSMLFSTCLVIVLASLLERPTRKVKQLAALLLPILLAGTRDNNRRLAWVQIAIVFLMVYLVSRETKLKKVIRRSVYAATPVFVGYLMAGWNVQYGRVFKPVQMIRSIVDSKSDGSTRWRDYENFDVISTFRDNPLLGAGYGHKYNEVIILPAVDYPLERYLPHNSLLGVWAFTGYVGFTALTLLWVTGIHLAMRGYHGARDSADRVAAIVSAGAIVIYMVQCWGDLGLTAWSGIFLMGSALTVSGKLAMVTGQWQNPWGSPKRMYADAVA